MYMVFWQHNCTLLSRVSSKWGVIYCGWCKIHQMGPRPLVSFVKCDPPSILHGGDKHYSAFKDVLAAICIVFSVFVNLEWHLMLRVMLEDPTSQPLKRLTLKGKSFLHNKQVGDRLHHIHLVRCLLIQSCEGKCVSTLSLQTIALAVWVLWALESHLLKMCLSSQ